MDFIIVPLFRDKKHIGNMPIAKPVGTPDVLVVGHLPEGINKPAAENDYYMAKRDGETVEYHFTRMLSPGIEDAVFMCSTDIQKL